MASPPASTDDQPPRCAQTDPRRLRSRQCIGHWDYWGTFMTWTRHYTGGLVLYRVVPYDHPAPETIQANKL